jgi:hypothetical protein
MGWSQSRWLFEIRPKRPGRVCPVSQMRGLDAADVRRGVVRTDTIAASIGYAGDLRASTRYRQGRRQIGNIRHLHCSSRG